LFENVKDKIKNDHKQGKINREVLKIYGQFNEFYDIILNPAESEIPHLIKIGKDSYQIEEKNIKNLITLAFAKYPELISE
jgi:hypothetical protein